MNNITDYTDALFYNRYWMKVEERAFYSVESLEQFGFYGSSSVEETLSALSELREARVTIIDIAEFHHEGYRLKFTDIDDAKEIYTILSGHLNNWLSICQVLGYVNPIPPITDFEKLDNLARVLFPYRSKVSWIQSLDPFNPPKEDKYNPLNEQGIYKSVVQDLFPYCAQVHGVPS